MKILYGTTNKGKLDLMRRAVSPLGIEIIGLGDLGVKIPDVFEDGRTPLENAEIKARAYFNTFKKPRIYFFV